MKNAPIIAAATAMVALATTFPSQAHASPTAASDKPVPVAQALGTQSVPTSGIRMHYNSWWVGSFTDYINPSNFGTEVFVAAGAGQGQPVKNNAASVCNFDGRNARIFYNSGWAGPSDFVPAKTCMNLVNTKNNNASWRWD